MELRIGNGIPLLIFLCLIISSEESDAGKTCSFEKAAEMQS